MTDENHSLDDETREISLDRLQSAVRMKNVPRTTPLVSSGRQREKQEMILVIHGVVERVTLGDNLSIILGRSSIDSDQSYFDLTPYGAVDRGVSRQHARIHIEDGRLYITDLGSTNGTYLAGQRLEPHMPTRIGTGDPLMLARLPIQILFK